MTVLLSVYSNCFALCNIHIVAFKAGIDDRLKFKDLVVKTVSIFIGKIPVYCNTTFTTWLIEPFGCLLFFCDDILENSETEISRMYISSIYGIIMDFS